MKKIKALSLLLILVLCVTGFLSCKRKGEEEVPPSTGHYYTSLSAPTIPTTALKLSLGGYVFAGFFDGKEYIKVSAAESGETRYGVVNTKGEIVVPVSFNKITMNGDFFMAEGSLANQLYHVYNEKGVELRASNNRLILSDIGDGIAVITEGSVVTLYDEMGEELLSGSSFDDSYAFSSCGKYLLATSTKRNKVFLFDRKTGDLRRSYLGTDTITYTLHYAGGDDFIVIANERVSADQDYTAAIKQTEDTLYLRQTVSSVNVVDKQVKRLSVDRFIYSLTNRYSVGKTETMRRNFSLKEEYFALCYYILDGKKSDGSYAYCLTDRSLGILKELPEGLSPFLTVQENYAVAEVAGSICVYNDSLDLLVKIDDATYQTVAFSCGRITASKLVGEYRVMGAFDYDGKVVIPFEYGVISSFVGDKAYAAKSGDVYLVDQAGTATFLMQSAYEGYWYWDGFYEKKEGDRISILSYDGKTLVPFDYDTYVESVRVGNSVFIALRVGSVTDVFLLD